MFLNFLAADGRVGLANACEKKAEIFIDFCGSAHRGARVSRNDLLLDGDGRRQSLDEVAFRLAHSTEKLAGIARQRLHIAALSFGIKGVESKGTLPRTAYPGNDNKLIAGDFQADIFQVVNPRPFDFYEFIFHLNYFCLLPEGFMADLSGFAFGGC